MAQSYFKPNHAGIAALGRNRELASFLLGVAGQIAAVAGTLAPRDEGDLADSIEVEPTVEGGVVGARVIVMDFKGHWYEFGTVRHSARPFLWPATEQILAGRAQLLKGG